MNEIKLDQENLAFILDQVEGSDRFPQTSWLNPLFWFDSNPFGAMILR